MFSRIFPLILKGAQTLADSLVNGKNLNKTQKQGLYAAFVLIETHGDEIAKHTNNNYDNETLAVLSDFCKDTLAEASIEVPVIPEELRGEYGAAKDKTAAKKPAAKTESK